MPSDLPAGIQPYRQFLDTLNAGNSDQYLRSPTSNVAHEGALEEMRAHLMRRYEGVEAQHSFMDANSSIFDCIPIEQQPSLRGSGEAVLKAPELPPGAVPTTDQSQGNYIYQLHPDRLDRHGNKMHAPDGTIPMRRLTLDDLTRFKTLRQFLQKSPFGGSVPLDGSDTRAANAGGLSGDLRGADLRGADLRGADLRGVDLRGADLRGSDLRNVTFGGANPGIQSLCRPSIGGELTVDATHRWATGYEMVMNGGGLSFSTIWAPPVNTGAGEVFSNAQQWYVNGSGPGVQTVEVGWHVYPRLYKDSQKPTFFIYWTADNYQRTGCHNLDCIGFVQVDNNWAFGAALPQWSTGTGLQYMMGFLVLLIPTPVPAWWIYATPVTTDTSAKFSAVGYYPLSIYKGGALTSGAAKFEVGGETVGTTTWPQMGSGSFAVQGFAAASHIDVGYYPFSGNRVTANLTPRAVTPNCYTSSASQSDNQENLFFGGPGGSNC